MLPKFLFILSLMIFLLADTENKVDLCFQPHPQGQSQAYASEKHSCCDNPYVNCSCGCLHTPLSVPILLLQNSPLIEPVVLTIEWSFSVVSRPLSPELPPPLT